jgi:Trk K+ transport system NAD-binding subunit
MLRRSDIFAAYSRSTGKNPPAIRLPSTLTAQGTEAVEITVAAGHAAAGKPIKDIDLPGDSIIVSIVRGGRGLIPRGNVTLRAGDRLLLLTTPDVKQAALNRLTESPQ